MGRIGTFLLGAIVGAGLLHVTTSYHIIYASDGFHLVQKSQSGFADPYVDIRTFSVGDWADHPQLAMAITDAGKQHLLSEAAGNSLNQGLEHLQQQFQQPARQP